MFFFLLQYPIIPNFYFQTNPTSKLETSPEVNLGPWEGMLAAERLVIEHFVGNPLALHDHVRFVHLGRVSNLRLLSRAFPSLCHSYICPTVGLFINKVLFRKNHMCVNFRQILFSGLREVFRICLNFSKMVLLFSVTTEKLKSASRHLCVVGLPPLYFDHPSPSPSPSSGCF